MSPFMPIGDRSRWSLIYDVLTQRKVGDTVTYDELGSLLELDPALDRHAIQMAARRAAKEYEEQDFRALEPIPNKGYRIVEPAEHLRLAKSHQRKSHKSLARGHSKVVHVDLSALEPEARKAFEVVAQAFAMQMDFNRRMDIRQSRLEDAIAAISQNTQRSSQEIADLRGRLERLESTETGQLSTQ